MSELMETKKKFSLEELSELTGISRRTIRFYIQKGLMNGPEGEKRGAYRRRKAGSSSRKCHRVLSHLSRRRSDTGC